MNKIILKDGKEILGVANIVISEIDDQIYINNSYRVENSIKGSIAVYFDDGTTELVGSGKKFTWNKETSTLEVEKINSKELKTSTLEVEKINSKELKISTSSVEVEKINSKELKTLKLDGSIVKAISTLTTQLNVTGFSKHKRIGITKWLGFNSKENNKDYPFKISLEINEENKEEVLSFITDDYKNNFSTRLIALEKNRLYLNKINIKMKTITSSIGSNIDIAGDIAIDENFIYVCTKKYDGKSKIWKRFPLTTW